MSFIFNTAIPAAANSPSADQPIMLANNVSSNAILAVDHITYNNEIGGNHLQVHLVQYTSTPVVNGKNTEGSVIFSGAGRDDPAHAQLFFLNPNITVPISAIRAFGYFDNNGLPIGNQYQNVGPITLGSTGVYHVTLTPLAVTSANFVVLVSSQQTSGGFFTVGNYVITGVGTFDLLFAGLSVGTSIATITGQTAQPQRFSFVVIQF
jgi:hypothetical protein